MSNGKKPLLRSLCRRGAASGILSLLLSIVVAAVTTSRADEPATTKADTSAAAEFFETRIRPLLLAHCVECHGAENQESGLRLDSREGVLKGSDEGPVVVFKEPEKSRLLLAVGGKGEIKMPPNGKLSAAEVAALTEWVKLGVPWPDPKSGALDRAHAIAANAERHWAFQPVQMPTLPPVKRDTWVSSPVDRFILARLEQAGLSPSPPADRRTLIRRASFDLIGLPPTAEEIRDFELDNSADAFAKVVDRLLASPHYGERWGRYWLDLARYSDSKGYIFTEDRNLPYAYTYRDWVISALNGDLPYDQFLLQQIAADCLPTRHAVDDPSLAAMGFLTLGRRFLGIKPDIIDDRIDVVFRTTMGLTVSCARCHDHKFDPIPTADYYSIYGVFDAAVEKQVPIETMKPEFAKGLREHEREVEQTLAEGHAKVFADLRAKAAGYLLAAHDANQRGAPRTDDFDFIPFLEDMNPFFVNRWRTYLDETARQFDPVMAPFHAFGQLPANEFAARASELAHRFAANDDADPQRRLNPLVAKLFDSPPPQSLAEVAERYSRLLNNVAAEWEKLLIDANQAGEPPPATLSDPAREQLRLVFYGPFAPTNVPTRDVELLLDQKTKDKVGALKRKLAAYAAGPGAPRQALILEEVEPTHSPRIFVRGNASRPGAEVPRQFLSAVSPDRKPFTNKSGRLEMAERISSADNPLTARVLVNRVWAGHFGAPLVRTPSDFGLRSEPPSHPELLDYLARTFMDDGWSLKRLHRQIMLSSTYQQASEDRTEPAAVDVENRLLWRMNRRRLDWEATRDALLAVSGQLDLALGGPAVEITTAPFSHRRTVYARIERQNLPGLFRAFDFASPDAHAPQRFTTTVPQQVLFLLNSPFVIERVEALTGRELVRRHTDSADKIRELYRLIFGREPSAGEIDQGLAFVATGESPPPPPSQTELLAAAWQYGYGSYDETAKRTGKFTAFGHFTGTTWQAGPALPDPQGGWAMLDAEGGHPGNDADHAAIRRWVAPRDGVVKIEGKLSAKTDSSKDGVRGRVVASRAGLVGEWIAAPKQKPQKTAVDRLEVKAGDTIDFVVDLRSHIENDEFTWTAVVELTAAGETTAQWDSASTFRRPRPRPLAIWSRYAQVLLLSNEFVFVD
jgi:cytochrome c553